jgi:hypothetical protein
MHVSLLYQPLECIITARSKQASKQCMHASNAHISHLSHQADPQHTLQFHLNSNTITVS